MCPDTTHDRVQHAISSEVAAVAYAETRGVHSHSPAADEPPTTDGAGERPQDEAAAAQ